MNIRPVCNTKTHSDYAVQLILDAALRKRQSLLEKRRTSKKTKSPQSK